MKPRMKIFTILLVTVLLQTIVACKPAGTVTDSISVIKAMFNAINKKQAETAANFFSEDGQLTTGFGQPTGIKKIRDFLQTSWIPLKSHFELKEINASDGTVTGIFTLQNTSDLFHNPTPMQLIAVVQNGKIKSMTWTTKK